jgi:hemerythrin-like domain-containing protein
MVRQWNMLSQQPCSSPALKIIQDDHKALASVLRALGDSVESSRRTGVPPDFEFLRAMLFYMDEMPARRHHAAEEQLLFPTIRERCPPLGPVLDRLEAEHSRSESTVQSLERALTAWEVMGNERRESFELLLRVYVAGYLGHMEVEENYVLPVAQEYLSDADWSHLHSALAHQCETLEAVTGAGHQALLRRILDRNPSAPGQT